jgi:Rnl2 family RNA ligase
MQFKKYSSIENTYRKKTLDEIFIRGLGEGDWVVSEKVHGSNFSLWMDEEGLRCAKRSGFLAAGDKFFNWESVITAYDQHISLLYQICRSLLDDLVEAGNIEMKDGKVEIVLFGELFGGSYNHKDVDRVEDAMRVQKGVQYCPWNDFYAFDLKINGQFIHYDIFAEIMENTGFHYAKALYRGPLDKCLKFQNDLPTSLPTKFGLPEIEDNVSEGVVIKPVQVKFFGNGSRVILKNKNEKFKEKEASDKTKAPKPKIKLTEQEKTIIDTASQYATENRLRNVISHIGEIDQKMFGKLLGLFCKDVLEEMEKDQPELFEGLEKDRRSIINKAINKNVQVFIRERFLNIIDGVF